MQQTNPSILLEPGVDDDLIVFGRAKCNTDDDRFYDPQCYSYEGKKYSIGKQYSGVKSGYSEQATKFEKIFHLKCDVTEQRQILIAYKSALK